MNVLRFEQHISNRRLPILHDVMLLIVLTTVVTLLLIPSLSKIAISYGLTDKPDKRKQHSGEVPLVGGIAIFGALMLGSLISIGSVEISPLLLTLCLAMLALGMVDDYTDLSARFRFLVQIIVAIVMVVFGDIRIENLGSLLGSQDVVLNGTLSLIFTVLCTVGVINAVNMIDGMDGLAGSILLISFSSLAGLAAINGDTSSAYTLFLIVGGLGAFLWYNSRLARPKAVIFMGDSGSMFLGLVLVWFFVDLTQSSNPALTPTAAGWILGLPLIETVVVMVGRIVDRKSPFDAGRDHLHHKLTDAGISPSHSVLTMCGLHVLLVSVGVTYSSTIGIEAFLFWAFVWLVLIHFVLCRYFVEKIGEVLTKHLRITD